MAPTLYLYDVAERLSAAAAISRRSDVRRMRVFAGMAGVLGVLAAHEARRAWDQQVRAAAKTPR
jgi:hypothetical protein